jgi:hypothetical protein
MSHTPGRGRRAERGASSRIAAGIVGLALVSALAVGCNDGSGRAETATPNFPIEVFEGTCPAAACQAGPGASGAAVTPSPR